MLPVDDEILIVDSLTVTTLLPCGQCPTLLLFSIEHVYTTVQYFHMTV